MKIPEDFLCKNILVIAEIGKNTLTSIFAEMGDVSRFNSVMQKRC